MKKIVNVLEYKCEQCNTKVDKHARYCRDCRLDLTKNLVYHEQIPTLSRDISYSIKK